MTDCEDSRAELRAELARVLELLKLRLAAQRESGRIAASEPLRGLAIDEDEVDGLVRELAADLARPYSVDFSEIASPAVGEQNANESQLDRAYRVFRMQPPEFDALILALAVEIDPRFVRIVAFLNDHVARTRPTVGLALAVSGSRASAVDFCQRPAVRHGLLVLEGDGPLASLPIRVAPAFLPRLAAAEMAALSLPSVRLRSDDGPELCDLVTAPAAHAILTRWSERLCASTPPPPVVLAGPAGSGRATAAQAASAAAGRRLIEVTWAPEKADRSDRLCAAVREALWHDATLLVRLSPDCGRDPDLTGLWTLLEACELPVALAVSPAHMEPVCAAAPTEPSVVHLGESTIDQRETLWTRLLPASATLSCADRRDLATRYDFLPGALARAVRRANAERANPEDPLDLESVSRACRAVGIAHMGQLSQRLPLPYTRADLVLPRELFDELDLASAWMRNRHRVFEKWGFGARISFGRGLSALFKGEPGTGKTMAAQVLARELGLELFRVDLSRIVDKYIGETEKNLSRLFDDARASGAILFFDEADTLFGKRSEVKDAHDRYANLEIGYLLQRMEEHVGATLLATNRSGDLDEAFTRRFHFILNFPMPGPPERRLIWEGMLPREADREPEIDIDVLAQNYEISGGEIRNSVLSAAFFAAEEGAPIGLRHLKRGLRRELIKTGRVLDNAQRQALERG